MASTAQLAAGSYDNINSANENKLWGTRAMYVCVCFWECEKRSVCIFVFVSRFKQI